MTLDEAIKHAREVAERIQKDADKQKGLNHGYYVWQSVNADEYRQIAEWLEELKEYKENKHRSLRYMYEKGYNKAIDDLTNKLTSDEFQKYNLDFVFETSKSLSYNECISAFCEYIEEIANELKECAE